MPIIPTIEIVMNSENLIRSEREVYSYAYLLKYVRENGGDGQLLNEYLAALVLGIATLDDFMFGIESGYTVNDLPEKTELVQLADVLVRD